MKPVLPAAVCGRTFGISMVMNLGSGSKEVSECQ
jgi:hypothetical protein